MYDAIVIGARCAGAPTAMLLAQKGWSVLLLDKNRFPSDTLSTHFIHPPGVARLARWGLLEQVAASNSPPIERWLFDLGHVTLVGKPPPVDGIARSYCPRRAILDQILVQGAKRAGVELRQEFVVRALVRDGASVVGVRGEEHGRASVTERARIVIGADGQRSVVAREVTPETYDELPSLTCAHYAYFDDVPIEGAEFCVREGRVAFAFPTNDGQTCVFIAWPEADYTAFRANVEQNFQDTLALRPSLAARIARGRRVGHIVGTAALPNYFRKPFGPGWALVGDAGHHRDPVGGSGISDAFRDAELLVDALHLGLSGEVPLERALVEYELTRNRAARPAYLHNARFAKLEPPPPPVKAFYAALAHDQGETDRFVGALMGTVPIDEFFAPANMMRIVSDVA